MMRIGIGYDAHQLIENRKLILGGIDIPFEKGLLGHSDADVLTHAIMDALLGALSAGSIGDFFPDTDHRYRGISSLLLLQEVDDFLKKKEFQIVNIDSVIVAQKPKLQPYILAIRTKLAETLHLKIDCVSVKATTTEKMGFEGRGEGIASQAVVLLENIL